MLVHFEDQPTTKLNRNKQSAAPKYDVMVIFPGFMPLNSIDYPTYCHTKNQGHDQLDSIETFTP
ncbi:hypothetical protein EMIT0P44_60104 [Pseudomonas sp. IT-P44]